MKRTLIFLVLVLIGLGLYFANSYAAGRAARELDAILAPKFEQAGASYGALEVAPASGTITLKDIAVEGEDVSVGEVSVQSTFEDLLAAAKGMPEFLHGLHVTVQDVAIAEEDAVVNLGSGEAHIDALIDIRALQDDPEAWIADLMQQEDVTLNVSGRDWIIRSEDMTRKLSLPSNLVRLDALNASLEKHGGNVATSMDLDSPDFGSMALSAEGNEEELGSLSMEVSDIAFQPDEDLRFALGNATVSLSGAVPIEALMKEDYEELLTERPKMQWSVRVSDFVAEGDELRDEDFPKAAWSSRRSRTTSRPTPNASPQPWIFRATWATVPWTSTSPLRAWTLPSWSSALSKSNSTDSTQNCNGRCARSLFHSSPVERTVMDSPMPVL